MTLSFRHLVSASQVTRPDADFLMERASEMAAAREREQEERERVERLRETLRLQLVALLFYEASTRTRLSFQIAARNLGADMFVTEGVQFSSISKGETLEDTIRIIAGYGTNLVVMRHPEAGSAARAAETLDRYAGHTGKLIPLINAGDGNNEHPTQALLDLYTIQKECGRLEHLHVALAGDLKNGRTVHSLAHMLSLYPGMRFTLASPEQLKMPDHVLRELKEKEIPFTEVASLDDALHADVLYMTRVQKERFDDVEEYERLKHAFILSAADLEGKNAVIMHPLPRVGEIAPDVDALPQAAYFRQAENGIAIRMALLTTMLGDHTSTKMGITMGSLSNLRSK